MLNANISPDSESFEHEMGSTSFKGYNLTSWIAAIEYSEQKEIRNCLLNMTFDFN